MNQFTHLFIHQSIYCTQFNKSFKHSISHLVKEGENQQKQNKRNEMKKIKNK